MRQGLRWLGVGGLALAGVLASVLLSSPLWLRPLVEARASQVLGRPVQIGALRLRPGLVLGITAEDVTLGNPPGFEAEAPLAHIARLEAGLDLRAWLHGDGWVVPQLRLLAPRLNAVALADGRSNYVFDTTGSSAPPPRIGVLTVEQGDARVALAPLDAEFQLAIATAGEAGPEPQLLVRAEGRYAGQALQGEVHGGALLNLRDAATPWPVRASLRNGPTTAELDGSLRDPLQLAGAALTLRFAGPDMGLLQPLTGVPFPKTPPYRIEGRLDFAAGRARFTDIAGTVGRSDLGGSIAIAPGRERPDVVADLHSRSLDLRDLAGVIGADPPGSPPSGNAPARPERLLPDEPLNLPKLNAADIHLQFRASRIQGRGVPLDNFAVRAEIVNGVVTLKPLSFGVGRGRIQGEVALRPQDAGALHGRADIRFERLDLSRIMRTTTGYEGSGAVSGRAVLDGTGASLAQMLARGDGGLILSMAGGTLSKLLVDLSGLRLGEALLSALGLPARTEVQCFVADAVLQKGILLTRALLLETTDTVTEGRGGLDFGRETIELRLRTESKHLTVGALPTPLLLEGRFRDARITPELAELAARGGIAGALAAIAPPLAALPTIQFGIGDDPRCESLIARARGAQTRR